MPFLFITPTSEEASSMGMPMEGFFDRADVVAKAMASAYAFAATAQESSC